MNLTPLYELATYVLAFLIAQALWHSLFLPLAVLHPVAFPAVVGVIVALLLGAVLFRRAEIMASRRDK